MGSQWRSISMLIAFSLPIARVAGQQPALAGLAGAIRSDRGGAAVRARIRVVQKPAREAVAPAISTGGVGSAPIRIPAPTNGPMTTSRGAATAATDATGGFDISANLAGDFIICVQPEDFEHLNPCKWGNAPTVKATANQKLSLGNIVVKRGVSLKVVVDDPTGLLGGAAEVAAGVTLQAGYYYGNGVFETMRLEAVTPLQNGNRFQFAAAIPPDVDLRVGLNSNRVTLTDERGGAVALNRAAYAVRATNTERQKVLQFRVSGRIGPAR